MKEKRLQSWQPERIVIGVVSESMWFELLYLNGQLMRMMRG